VSGPSGSLHGEGKAVLSSAFAASFADENCLTLTAQLLKHTLVLLTDSFQSVSAPLVQQRDVVVTSALQVQSKASGAGPGGAAKAVTPTMFILILEVLAALLDHGIGSSTSQLNSGAVDFEFNSGFAANAALLLSMFDNSHYGAAESSATTVSVELAEEISVHVTKVWQNLVMNSSALSMDVLSSLLACTKILLCLSRKADAPPSFGGAVHVLFRHFPHSCTEATLAAPGSEKERQGKLKIAQLDTSLCELAFIHIAAQDRHAVSDAESAAQNKLRTQATAYLLQTLRGHVDAVSGVRGESPGEPERHAAVKMFKSFVLLLSRNTLGELQELLELLYQLFASLREVRASSRRALNYLTTPATECLCCIIDRLHVELSESYGEPVYVLLVDSLDAALSLALTATWDQTALLSKLVDSTLKVFSGRAGAFDAAPMTESLARLCATYETVWTPPSSLGGVHASTSGKTVFHNGYASCPHQTRLQLLDIFLYAPFEDTYAVSAQILEALCSSQNAALAEQSYFLRLLLDRYGGVVVFVHFRLSHRCCHFDVQATRAGPAGLRRAVVLQSEPNRRPARFSRGGAELGHTVVRARGD
jgi:hypothetical protein